MFGGAPLGNLAGIGVFGSGNSFYTAPAKMVLDAAAGKGMEISATWTRRGGSIFFDMNITNKAMAIISDFAIVFNKNR